ncbi:MAG: class I SAM-dependent methyltransferase [Candidatus Omnitrophica bacterium]|nr:class I SAM-dependent methyltransferase [Candidatus Omnitrophota bacterium]
MKNKGTNIKRWVEQRGQIFLKEIGVKKGQTILDFGCGEGHYSIPAAKIVGDKGKVYALDKDINSLNVLKNIMQQNAISNIEIINEDSRVPLENESVDIALCYDVIHYEKNRKIIYNEVYRLLKPTGFLSVYPKHCKEDQPLMELANINLKSIVNEINEAGFILEHKFSKWLLHNDYYNEGYILNFRR